MPQLRTRKEANIGMLGVRAATVPDSVDIEQRTIDCVFATDSPVTRFGWTGDWIERLSLDPTHVRLDRADAGVVPLLDNHRQWEGSNGVLGSIRNVRIEGGKAYCTLAFADTPDVENTWNKVRQGHIKGVSVGYRVHEYQEVTPNAGPNSRNEDATPEYLATDWEVYEVSIAPIPADFNSATRSDNRPELHQVTIIRNNNSKITMREQLIRTLKERGISVDENITDEDLNALVARSIQTAPPAPPAPAPAPAPAGNEGDQARAAEQARTAERTRISEIQTICRKAGVEEETVNKYINDGVTIENVRAAVLERYQATDPNKGAAPAARVGEDREVNARRDFMAEAIVLRSGSVRDFKPTDANEVNKYRFMTLLDMAKVSLRHLGVDTDGMNPMEIVKRAITSSSSDFPVLLDGTNRRILLNAYETMADSWREFCSIGSVSDFRDYKRLRPGAILGTLDALPENGEYKNKKISDADFESVNISTVGNMINLTRKMIINDDLNGFSSLAAGLGRTAARTIELAVYDLINSNSGLGPVMQDGNTLIHSTHNNISTGAALSMAALEADRLKMALKKDKGNQDYLSLRPNILLINTALGASARDYNESQYDIDATGKYQKPNQVRGLFGKIVDNPRIDGTKRYLLVDPNIAPVFEVNFLNGVQTPYIESELGFDVDGIRWKVRHDFGVDAVGHEGIVYNAGA